MAQQAEQINSLEKQLKELRTKLDEYLEKFGIPIPENSPLPRPLPPFFHLPEVSQMRNDDFLFLLYESINENLDSEFIKQTIQANLDLIHTITRKCRRIVQYFLLMNVK